MATPAGTPTLPANTNVTAGQSCDEHLIDIDTEIWADVEASNANKATPCESGLPRIPKVPATLKNSQNQKLPQWIQPSVVSIGPYYYNHKNLQKAQMLKSLHAEKFVEVSKQRRDDLYRKIKRETPELRKCYDNQEISQYKDNQLATMFLLDGCFLLHFIYYSGENDAFSNLDFTNHEMAYIKQDLFLLENQLPYHVLKLLFQDGEIPKPSMQERIKHFVATHVPFPLGVPVEEVNQEPCHLLHYLQGVILYKPGTRQNQDNETRRHEWHSCNGRPNTVQELKKVGIHFKPSPTSYLTDISFKSQFCTSGCLKLPTIVMNTSTVIIFLNLVAFESSNTSKNITNNLGVISYLCFLDSLIDHWDDVKELQAAGIVHNFVGEQREVAQFFNNVCSKLVPNTSAYNDIMVQIESHVARHNKTRWRKNYIQFKQKYFSSPWSFIALIGAVIGLSLTAIQAYTSFFPK